jgi:hypothetical protein
MSITVEAHHFVLILPESDVNATLALEGTRILADCRILVLDCGSKLQEFSAVAAAVTLAGYSSSIDVDISESVLQF